MFRVKISTIPPFTIIARQTPGSSGRWGDYQFYINDDTKECDWWVVLEGIKMTETALCPKDRTILIISEPISIKKYNPEFVNQFHAVISASPSINHPNIFRESRGYNWLIGCNYKLGTKYSLVGECAKNYDALKEMHLPVSKRALISVIASDKKSTPEHIERSVFVEKLKEYFRDTLDVYGRGINNFSDKWDVIAPYKYHIVLENLSSSNYWTEKINDAFLAGSYPIYYGCSNMSDYFPVGAFQPIDIKNTKEAMRIIEKCIAENTYEQKLELIGKSKNLVLDTYNIFPFLCDKIFRSREVIPVEKKIITIKPEEVRKPGIFSIAQNTLSRIKNTRFY